MLANRAVLSLSLVLVFGLALAYGLTLWRYRRRWAKQESFDGRDRRYHRDVAAVGVLLALVGGFFWRPLFGSGVTMPHGGGDLVSFFYPIHVFASETLRGGEIPLWNPHLFGGMPFAADIQSGLFYPLNWFFWLAGSITYEKVEMLALVHYWLAASFAFALARSLGLGRWPGLVAGTLYAFSGFAVSHLGHLPMLAAAAWFPLVLLAVNQAARPLRYPGGGGRQSWRWPVAVGLLLAISLLAGHFQLFLYNFYAALIFWLAIAWRGRVEREERRAEGSEGDSERKATAGVEPDSLPPSVLLHNDQSLKPASAAALRPPRGAALAYWRGQFLRLALAVGVMGLATLVQVWPFYELGQLSVRSSISYETSTGFGVWPVGLIDLLLPNLFSPNPQAYFGYWSNTDVLGYVGLFSLGLAGLGVLLGRAGRSSFYPIFFAVLGGAGLIFSLAGYTIFQGWFYQFVPALNLTRGAGRFLVWFDLGVALAAAFGLQSWLEYQARHRQADAERVLRWGWRSLALAGVALLVVPLPILYAQLISTPGSINDLLVRGIDGLVTAVILLGLGAILLRLLYRRRVGPDLGAFLALALVVFDLFSVRAEFNPQTGDVANGFYHDATAAFIRSQDAQGQYRLDATVGSVTQAWQANTAQLYRLNDLRGVFNPLQLAGYEALWNGITSSQKDFRAVPAYNLLGARYVIARNKEDPTGTQFRPVYRDARPGVKLNVFENSQALPLVTLVHRTELKPQAEILPALLGADFKPGELAFLEKGRKLDGPAGLQNSEGVRLLEHRANRLQVEANLTSEGYVLINQAFYPGWQARLDGVDTTLERANYALGAVYLPPGQHTLTLEFAPLSFRLGGPITLATWLLATGFLVWPLLRGRWRRPKPQN